jgi:TolA-binding protein
MTTRLCLIVVLAALAGAARLDAQVPPDKQAEMALNAARKAYNDGNPTAARDLFKQFLQKFGGHPQATAARYGLGLALGNSPEQDFAAALEPLNQAAGDGGFADRGLVLYHLALCHRAIGSKQKDKPAADRQYADAARRFAEARDWFAAKKNDDRAGRCRCDQADAELRAGRVKEARNTVAPFEKDAAFAKNKHRPLGLYYHGLACFLDRDYTAAGRSLNQLAPFHDPAFGPHARYLVGRVLHLGGENAEASVHYDAVRADFDQLRKDAAEALKQPDRFKTDPAEKARLEAVANGPLPEYVAGAAFHGACLNYEAGKFGEALAKFLAFVKDHPSAPLVPDAKLRVGFCQVQLKQYDEAVKTLLPLPDQTPRLADQALYWLAKARVAGATAAADPTARTNLLTAAAETFRKAAEKASQLAPQDPDAKARRGDILMDLGDAQQLAGQYQPAAQTYETIWNERLLPEPRHEEALQRLAAAWGAAGDLAKSDQRCAEFAQRFPQSTLLPAVVFRTAENAYTRAAAVKADDTNRAAERKQRFAEAAKKYQEAADRFPEFERVNFARYGAGVCLAQLGNLEAAAKVLDAIPTPERNGDLAGAAYLLADCLIRLAPDRADDALAENMIREKLTAAAGLLESYVASNPKAADAPDAYLKLGLCLKRLGATLADANERTQLLNKAREVYEKLAADYPQSPQAGHARLERAKVRALLGDRAGAFRDLQRFTTGSLQQSPVAPLAALHHAALLREDNKPADAAKVLADARSKYEKDLAGDKVRFEWAHLLKYHHGVALFESQKPAEAGALFEGVVSQAKGKPLGAEAALRAGQCGIAEGRKRIEVGRQERAKPNLKPEQVAAAEKVIADGRGAVARAAARLEQWCGEFAPAMPAGESRAGMLYDAAWAYRSLADDKPAHDRAFPAYQRLIDEFPDLSLAVDARFELAELRADRGEHDVAVKLLKEALDKEPADRAPSPELLERVRLRLGGSLAAKKDYAAALAQFDIVTANAKSPHRPQALYRAGDCLFAAGDFAKAAEKLAAFRDRGELHNVPGVSDRAVVRLGQAYLAAKNWDAARQTFVTALARYGTSPAAADARYGLGWALQQQGKYDEAVGQYEQVTKLTTAEVAAKAQTQIGLCRMAQKRYADAATALMVVPYTYDYPELGYAAVLEAARAFAADGKPDQAERLLRKLLKDAPPDSEWAKAARERLGEKK